MGEEKQEGVLEHNAHKFALGGQAVALGSLLFLVPVFRKLRAQRHEKPRRHFPSFGH